MTERRPRSPGRLDVGDRCGLRAMDLQLGRRVHDKRRRGGSDGCRRSRRRRRGGWSRRLLRRRIGQIGDRDLRRRLGRRSRDLDDDRRRGWRGRRRRRWRARVGGRRARRRCGSRCSRRGRGGVEPAAGTVVVGVVVAPAGGCADPSVGAAGLGAVAPPLSVAAAPEPALVVGSGDAVVPVDGVALWSSSCRWTTPSRRSAEADVAVLSVRGRRRRSGRRVVGGCGLRERKSRAEGAQSHEQRRRRPRASKTRPSSHLHQHPPNPFPIHFLPGREAGYNLRDRALELSETLRKRPRDLQPDKPSLQSSRKGCSMRGSGPTQGQGRRRG